MRARIVIVALVGLIASACSKTDSGGTAPTGGMQPPTKRPTGSGGSSGSGGAPTDDPTVDAAMPPPEPDGAAAPSVDAPGGNPTTPDSLATMPPATPGACVNLPRPAEPVRVTEPFPQLPAFTHPTLATQAPGQPEFWYVGEQVGRLLRFPNRADASAATAVLDLSSRTDSDSDAGLLGLAFHPDFVNNGEVYVSYVHRGTQPLSRLSRFKSADKGATFDLNSEQVLIEIPQPDPEKIHLNCDIHFGTDGYLWVGFGDGGVGEDDRGFAQNLGNINGKILRLDVNKTGPGGLPYAIPADNPFVGRAGARGEVWAVGFRNPWRWRFDPTGKAVFVGDIGADKREEITRLEAGGNAGWKYFEGTICREPPCPATGLQAPVVEYPHAEGGAIVTGPVYRGQKAPSLRDRLVYGDYMSGNVWALPADRGPNPELIASTGLQVVSFGEPLDEELILVDWAGGRLHQIVATPSGTAGLPTLLSQTGCLAGAATAAATLVPYDVNAPLWSDGASKRRWMSLPPGGKIEIAADGDFNFPTGTTLVKEFSVGATKVETRLFIRHDDGWAGYSYGWNNEQTDAVLLGLSSKPSAKTVAAASWTHPSRAHCLQCHKPEAGYTLGLEIAQLNRNFAYPEGVANQLTHLQQAGLLAAPLSGAPADLPALTPPDGNGPLAARARSYLHGNCAGCHRPNGEYPDSPDLRFTTSLGQSRLCNVKAIQFDIDGATTRVSPGRPNESELLRLMRGMDGIRMPIVGTTQADPQGTALIESWIASLKGCN